MDLVKATIEILSGDRRRIEVQFNPNSLSFRKEAVVNEIGVPGLGSPLLQFVRGEAETLEFELFCDTTRDGLADDARDVREHTQPIRSLLEIDPAQRAIPVVRFSWGKGLSFTGVVVSVHQHFTLFSPAGVPLRAQLALRLKEHRTLEQQVARHQAPLAASARDSLLAPVPLAGVEIRQNGKALALDDDLLAFTLRDQVDGEAEFELTFNDWDAAHGRCKYADSALLDPGRSLEIRFRAPLVRSARSFVKGVITRVRHATPADGQPRLVVAGSADERRQPDRGKKAPLRLAYGESLLEIESEIVRAPARGGPARAKSHAELEVVVIGTSHGMAGLRAGAQVEIDGVGKRFSGRFLVVGTTHTIDDSGYATRFECRRDGTNRR